MNLFTLLADELKKPRLERRNFFLRNGKNRRVMAAIARLTSLHRSQAPIEVISSRIDSWRVLRNVQIYAIVFKEMTRLANQLHSTEILEDLLCLIHTQQKPIAHCNRSLSAMNAC
jgi:hypothetical protein